jgi:hypothetical protein
LIVFWSYAAEGAEEASLASHSAVAAQNTQQTEGKDLNEEGEPFDKTALLDPADDSNN